MDEERGIIVVRMLNGDLFEQGPFPQVDLYNVARSIVAKGLTVDDGEDLYRIYPVHMIESVTVSNLTRVTSYRATIKTMTS